MKISIIIPCLNEEEYLEKSLAHLQALSGNFEIIVVDGGSTDRSRDIAASFEEVILSGSAKGRAIQMNYGADLATGEILLFLHADTFLPLDFYESILNHIQKHGCIGGSFKLNFNRKHPLLNFYSFCSKMSLEFFTYGDHAIFIKRSVFQQIGGYSNICFMEDVEIQKRLRKAGKFAKLSTAVTTSARRFEKEGILRQLLIDVLLVSFYKLGIPPARLKKFYKDHA